MTSRRFSTARALRQKAGLAEEKVWALLRGGRIDDHKFRRQHPIGPYIVDFACDGLRLVIEIDGGVHERDDVVLNDHLRQVELERLGWTVVRFKNEDAIAQPERITQAVRVHARLIEEHLERSSGGLWIEKSELGVWKAMLKWALDGSVHPASHVPK